MIKWILAFMFTVLVLGLALDVFAQGSIVVLDPSGTIKEIIILPPPPPVWR
jgi:hypothetical protein